jgi:hypothetical protein
MYRKSFLPELSALTLEDDDEEAAALVVGGREDDRYTSS